MNGRPEEEDDDDQTVLTTLPVGKADSTTNTIHPAKANQ
jgi:hypothetical protein